MVKGLVRHTWLGTIAAAWAFTCGSAHAQQSQSPHRCTIDAGINVRFNVQTVPNVVPRAPWYTYFPYDPHLMAPPAASPYPTWPRQFPPKDAPGATAPSPGYTPLAPRSSPIASMNPMLQPVGYIAVPTPSYWYDPTSYGR